MPAAPSTSLDRMISWALDQRGKPYVWGGTGPTGYDCSGLMEKAAAAAGITLPRTSQEQRNAGVGVPLSQIARGDLVTFTYNDGAGNPGPGNHVALYVGGGQVVEAARPGVPIRVAPLDTAHVDRVRRLSGGGTTGGGTTGGGAAPADNITTGGPTAAGLQLAGYDAVVHLTPWGIPLNPFKLPGYIGGKLGGLAGDAAGGAAKGVWDAAGPVILASVGVIAGLSLAVLGVYAATKPMQDAVEDKITKLLPMAV
jgi:hypothetical protein